jgi:hypothetical protein
VQVWVVVLLGNPLFVVPDYPLFHFFYEVLFGEEAIIFLDGFFELDS